MKIQIPSLSAAAAIWFVLAPIAASGQLQAQVKSAPAGNGPAVSQNSAAQTSAGAKPVKVWSNDDIDGLGTGGVSTVGNEAGARKNAGEQPGSSKANSAVKGVAWYRQQLAPLRAEVAKLDSQIQNTKAFIQGENVGQPQTFRHAAPITPVEQVKGLEDKRKADEAKIDDLLDRARRAGIASGSLQ